MIKINIVAVGRVKEKYFQDGIDEYLKRLKRFANVNIYEAEEVTFKKEDLLKAEEIKIAEGKSILKKASGYIIALCIEGKKTTSIGLSEKIFDVINNGCSEITFIIGGSYGLSDEVKSKADYLLSFSDMTFPHTLFRLILTEQIYRAFMIHSGSSYHK